MTNIILPTLIQQLYTEKVTVKHIPDEMILTVDLIKDDCTFTAITKIQRIIRKLNEADIQTFDCLLFDSFVINVDLSDYNVITE